MMSREQLMVLKAMAAVGAPIQVRLPTTGWRTRIPGEAWLADREYRINPEYFEMRSFPATLSWVDPTNNERVTHYVAVSVDWNDAVQSIKYRALVRTGAVPAQEVPLER